MTDFKNAAELLALCKAENLKISEVMLRRETELGETTVEAANSRMLRAGPVGKSSARELPMLWLCWKPTHPWV